MKCHVLWFGGHVVGGLVHSIDMSCPYCGKAVLEGFKLGCPAKLKHLRFLECMWIGSCVDNIMKIMLHESFEPYCWGDPFEPHVSEPCETYSMPLKADVDELID